MEPNSQKQGISPRHRQGNSTVSSNAVGISANRTAVVPVSQSTATANGTGLQTTNGSHVLSFGNNNVGGNETDGVATTTVAMK
jgi:hypothetical protein